jgi:hypothetical protein
LAKERSIAHDDDAISEALGSADSVLLGSARFGPPGLLALAHRFNERLKSTGGRPTDPHWTVTRRVPFAPETWSALNTIAQKLSTAERKVAPAQVAAALIEDGIAGLDEAGVRAFARRVGAKQSD